MINMTTVLTSVTCYTVTPIPPSLLTLQPAPHMVTCQDRTTLGSGGQRDPLRDLSPSLMHQLHP